MGFAELLDLMKTPFRLIICLRQNHDQEVGICQRFINIFRKIAGQLQFILVAEDPVNFPDPGLLSDSFWNMKPLQLCLEFRGNKRIPLIMPVRDECIIFSAHRSAPISVFQEDTQ